MTKCVYIFNTKFAQTQTHTIEMETKFIFITQNSVFGKSFSFRFGRFICVLRLRGAGRVGCMYCLQEILNELMSMTESLSLARYLLFPVRTKIFQLPPL